MKRAINRNKLNIVLLLFSLVVLTFLFFKDIFVLNSFNGYSIISTNAIFAGFLYTGLGIVVSVIDKEIIKYLDKHGYIDGYINGIKTGLIFHIISILIAFGLMLMEIKQSFLYILQVISFGSMLIGVVFFVKSVFNILKLIRIVREENLK